MLVAGVGDVRFTHESGHAPSHPEMSAKCQKWTLRLSFGEQVREAVRRTLGALKLHSRHRQTFHDLD